MAEAHTEAHVEHDPHAAPSGHGHAEHKFDPGAHAIHHITDKVLAGVDASTGAIRTYPYDDHTGVALQGYVPKMIGPMKLEFTKHMFGMTVAATIIFLIGWIISRAVLNGLKGNSAPKGKLTNAVEAVITFIRDELVEPVGGHHLGHYTPIFITYFFFILVINLLGMVPEYGTATGNFGLTLALGGSVYGLVWILGMANQGPVNFVLHLVPPGTPLWMWPLMFVLELLGPLIKCFVLAVRLFANMIAGHLIIGTVLGLGTIGGALPAGIAGVMLLIGVPLAIGISMLEILVCFLQAYVFTLLAVVFIGAAVHPEH
jgi:F-type H+-transporting ATPase subunit a